MKLVAKREKLLIAREKAIAAELRDLEKAAKRANRSLGGRVQVSAEAEANRDALRDLVAKAVSGRIKDAVDNIIAKGSVFSKGSRETDPPRRTGIDRCLRRHCSPGKEAR